MVLYYWQSWMLQGQPIRGHPHKFSPWNAMNSNEVTQGGGIITNDSEDWLLMDDSDDDITWHKNW